MTVLHIVFVPEGVGSLQHQVVWSLASVGYLLLFFGRAFRQGHRLLVSAPCLWRGGLSAGAHCGGVRAASHGV
jgi:hypothetical protein